MLAFALSNWKLLAIGLLGLLLTMMSNLYVREVQKYRAFVAQVTATGEAQKKKLAHDKEISDEFIALKESEHVKEIADLHASWVAELDRVRKHAGGGGAAKPVPLIARVCDDAAANAELSAAVQVFEQRIDSAIGIYQEGIGRLLEGADKDAAALRKVNEWAAGEALINR